MKQQSKDNRTRYDWAPGREGRLLAPEGSRSVQQQVVVGVMRHDTLRILFDGGRLYGKALDDAEKSYRGTVPAQSGIPGKGPADGQGPGERH